MTLRPHWNKVVGAAALAAVCLIALTAHAAVNPDKPLYVFEAIDDVGTEITAERRVVLSGLEQGASEPVEEVSFTFDTELLSRRCDRYALLMMERPGRYLLELRAATAFRWQCRLRVRTE